ncbi:MAG TPA: 3-hydroxyacyl-CoA dehydrogenase family protein, partial [bacterium]|nr:3-hydroxyacyl-CoA dehydrogenase family protein [bacterium]
MGSAIAAHLANAGISVLLLDVRPSALLDDERSRGLTLEHPQVRNRLAAAGKQRALHAQPAAFFVPARAQLVETGNFDDHLSRIAEADWVLEAVIEDLPIKQQVLAQVARYWKPGTLVSTNTSGLPVREIAAGCPDALRRHFLGTHFFNPPRYLRLLELIPLPGTDPEIVAAVSDWGDRLLGKGIVHAHDTPNFIANRIG